MSALIRTPAVLIAAAGSVLLGAGSLLPWVDAEGAVFGRHTADGVDALGLRQGLAGGDAWVTVVLACLSLLVTGLFAWRRGSRARLLLAVSGTVGLLWPIASASSIPDGVGVGVGVWVTGAGGLLVLAGSAMLRIDPDARYDARLARAHRLWERGRLPDAIAEQQRVVEQDLRENGWSREAGLNGMILASMYAEAGDRPRCLEIMNDVVARCTPVFTDEDKSMVDQLWVESHQQLADRGA
ncbi:hypothetical protein IM660_09370 [Ruania alkalisoli]|uniref:Uncharacterized protein n=1 Tax=Ruania alkalisoli TaxID=2779775 RepID=A0A7M1SZL4_9MICO|nr:hypothetical protein [Ruania alkalisoli]QOR72404.1 hypothetical protein IM660_09370 [Ruania alkalisoli]